MNKQSEAVQQLFQLVQRDFEVLQCPFKKNTEGLNIICLLSRLPEVTSSTAKGSLILMNI